MLMMARPAACRPLIAAKELRREPGCTAAVCSHFRLFGIGFVCWNQDGPPSLPADVPVVAPMLIGNFDDVAHAAEGQKQFYRWQCIPWRLR